MMPLEKIFTALFLGLSAERLLVCPFLALSFSLSDRWAGLKFILGRLIGLSLLGAVISAIGLPFQIPPRFIDGLFGGFLLVTGIGIFFKSEHKNAEKKMSLAGFWLGLFRGLLNPGRKIAYLLPLLWGVSLPEGLAISLAYGLSSSLYLLLGFFSAELLHKLAAHRRKIRLIGAGIIVALGLYYLFKAF